MKFGEALEIIKQGGVVCRAGWDGGRRIKVSENWPAFYKEIVLDTPSSVYTLYSPSAQDMFADDWQEVVGHRVWIFEGNRATGKTTWCVREALRGGYCIVVPVDGMRRMIIDRWRLSSGKVVLASDIIKQHGSVIDVVIDEWDSCLSAFRQEDSEIPYELECAVKYLFSKYRVRVCGASRFTEFFNGCNVHMRAIDLTGDDKIDAKH